MKLMKYTFRTPLYGSIECEELLSDTDGRIELSPEQMARMYDQDLMRFLTENSENLVYCLPEELENVVLCAEFGDFAFLGGKMWLRTYIYTEHDLTETGRTQIQNWILGQMSDGWGEGLEQRAWKEDTVSKPVMYFDEYSMEFDKEYVYCQVSYYAHPWNSEEFYIYLDDCEEVEVDTQFEIVATMALPFRKRQVVKLSSGLALRNFLKDFNQAEFATTIEDQCPEPGYTVYLVTDTDGPSGVEILPKWVCEKGAHCAYYDMSEDEEVRGTQVPISRAVLELLQ